MKLTIDLDARAEEILNRLRGEMTPSSFSQMLLRMVDTQAVSPPVRGVEQEAAHAVPDGK